MAKISNMETLSILGIGAGRCGTKSLASTLANQPKITCTHEVARGGDNYSVQVVINHLLDGKWDVGMQHLMWLPHIAQAVPNLKIIYITRYRDYEGWVKSLRMGRHVEQSMRKQYPYELYRHGRCKKIEDYIDLYNTTAQAFGKALNVPFLVLDLEELNSRKGLDRILAFCGIPQDKRDYKTFHEHMKSRVEVCT